MGWEEKVWLDNKKAGNTGSITNNILFIGDIKGTEQLKPIIDYKFANKIVSYGFAGKQALISYDINVGTAIGNKILKSNAEIEREYDTCLREFRAIDNSEYSKKDVRDLFSESGKKKVAKIVTSVLVPFAAPVVYDPIGYNNKIIEADKLARTQMLMYGVTHFYLHSLEEFMKN